MSGLSVAEPSAPETLIWNKGPEAGRILELCKKELAGEDANPEEESMGELDEEQSSGEMFQPSNTGSPKCGEGFDLRFVGERAKPGEGCIRVMTSMDQSGLSEEILVPCEEELLGDSALSDQLLSGHMCQVQPLPPEKNMEELQLLCQKDQQN